MIRRFFVWLHRWTGLAMAAFLILVGLTGSMLAFRTQIDHMLSPRFYAPPHPGPQLDFDALTDHAEALVPQGQVYHIIASPDQIRVALGPRKNPANGKPYDLDLAWLFLNPWTGEELGRVKPSERDPAEFMATVAYLHEALCMGSAGLWFMGIVALIWSIDCFVGFYLTLPASPGRFWQRWKVAWQVKWRASAFRVNFDLHRASGLWLWPVLFLFAWSGVLLNIPTVYHRVVDPILKYQPPAPESMSMAPPGEAAPPRLDFRTAIATAQRTMAEQAAVHGFAVVRPGVFEYEEAERKYFYSVKSSRDVWDTDQLATTILTFDADTGALRALQIPSGEHAGNTVVMWLYALHFAWVFGLPYQIFVGVLGLVIAVLSYTGVYIWWKKRRTRVHLTEGKRASPPGLPPASAA